MDSIRLHKVLIADDHALVRAGFSALVAGINGFAVVAEAADGLDVLRLVRKLHPDIVLADIAMPGMNGIELTGRISWEIPASKVIILSMHADEEYVIRALRSGASGYILKDSGTDELELALRSVISGKIFLCPSVSRQVIDEYVMRTGAKVDGNENELSFERLSPRQKEVLQLIAEGLTIKEIAARLDLSIKTVETHRTQIRERLDIHDVAGLVRYAIRTGLITLE